ncbi:FAD/NAD(P)-binding protein [Pseudomonas cichorii]|uniref:FAD/NAD(P)-binding protein n=1 Tax=Pseudomonas lijiangensis TaxID=2995658 RepID=A0ABX8HL61_9PSED|nr:MULTISPECIES: FAD/NAD(P)-binding domain-containing protein [Pseudomonas syringae group]MBX8488471.1 FAD/NAD(P)-binding protein [Pseudomonas cichorii]MBX8493702.1 FAD/NAD(P)-binding protein [Pseudomonas cichorii]MBX8498473.1 FAD/NAD(P)-binding protein [Pseudomonas lijiangensis]MBX8503380.1 FAD/NAD(P)-binding protein [Pseudomonas lijiangensis]MBX8510293.1 FAD/NAD(P)-binding protein [Pseudomonas cichorii]
MQTLSIERFVDDHAPVVEPETRKIAIIGMGSRGLSILEQLIGMARDDRSQRWLIDVFDPQLPGSGLHLVEQPDYLMLNTMAGQLSAFSSAYPVCEPAGMTFLQWCTAHDVRLNERGHTSDDEHARPIGFGDFVPRKLLGRYLQDSYRFLLEQCPAHVQVRHDPQAVTGCQPLSDTSGFRLQTANGRSFTTEAVFLTSGHAPETREEQAVGEHVAIEGLGLTAMDTLAGLTEGRGGRYERDAGFAGWRYIASGREPHISLFSRSGLAFHARPQWSPASSERLPRLFFTAQAIEVLRQQSATGQLDFEQDILPLIEDEMRGVFYQARVRLESPDQLASVQQRLRDAKNPRLRETLFVRLAAEWGEFEPARWLPTRRWTGQASDYSQWYRDWIEHDLALSRRGIAQSPVKQALEVWRDYRDLLRMLVDRNGLTPASTLEFYGTWAGLSNRLVGGPQKERYEDLLALMDAGVVQVLPPMEEAGCSGFDRVINARVPHSGLSRNPQGLIGDLQRQGLVRAAHAYPADGIETDSVGRALSADGSVQQRLWVLGPAVEGCTFYNHYVPTPDPGCRALIEARRAVESCMNALGVNASTAARL